MQVQIRKLEERLLRRLRLLGIVLFILALTLFGFNMYREKVAKDQTGPVFNMESNIIEVSVNDGQEALLKGMTVTDAHDGDVTDKTIVEAVSPFTGTGRRIVSYAAFDSDNHVTHAKRELVYKDYYAPRFYLEKPLIFAMNATNLLNGVHVNDCIDGDISKNVKLVSEDELDTSHVGEYKARLKVSNSAGGVSYLPVTIEIYDASVRYRRPQINLSDYIVYVEKGRDFDEEDYLKSILVNGTEYEMTDESGTYGAKKASGNDEEDTVSYDRVDITSDVDTNVTGCYEVVYSFDDTAHSTGTGTTRLYVVVVEGRAE